MLDVINLIFLGAMALANIVLHNTADTPLPAAKGEVVTIAFREEAYNVMDAWGMRDTSGFCRWTGVAIPYARTWEETVSNGYVETVLSSEPDKIAGYALLINKKQCPGKADEAMFRVATMIEPPTSRFKGTLMMGYAGRFVQLASLREDERPRWLPQVLGALANAAKTNPAAKEFVDYTHQAEEAARATKNHETGYKTGYAETRNQ